jgi:hypothetical protein
MKVISWDIGIKHLAYCVINKYDDKNFDIIDWGIIDISDTDNLCFYCKSKAKYTCSNKFLCTKHKKKQEIPTIESIYPTNKIKEKCKKCDKLCIRGGMCAKHAREEYNENYKIKKIQSCMKQSLQTLCLSLFEKLDEKIKFPVDYVLIENQPTYTNPKMKSISIMVFSYFISKGVMLKKINEVKLISPLDKLKLDKEKSEMLLKNCTTKSQKYRITKQIGEEICRNLIKEKENAIQLLNLYKKQDDMCDAFLQGYYYLYKM